MEEAPQAELFFTLWKSRAVVKWTLCVRYLNVVIPVSEHASKIVNLCSAARLLAAAASRPLVPCVDAVRGMKQQV